jgi:hypothetical protein
MNGGIVIRERNHWRSRTAMGIVSRRVLAESSEGGADYNFVVLDVDLVKEKIEWDNEIIGRLAGKLEFLEENGDKDPEEGRPPRLVRARHDKAALRDSDIFQSLNRQANVALLIAPCR